MRNLIDGIKGELFDRARNYDNENMNWDLMAERLHRGENNGVEHKEILRQESIRSKIVDELSKAAKDREGSNSISIQDLWTKLINHLYVLLNSIHSSTI